MDSRLSTEQVLALAPDAASAVAGRKLAATGSWSRTGVSAAGSAVWGECAGSVASPYLVSVDLGVGVETGVDLVTGLAAPAFRCSCPSRKFPCKHALALLLRLSAGMVPESSAPEEVASWLESRTAKGSTATPSDDAPDRSPASVEASAEAARKRVEQRDERMAGGQLELAQWLRDQVRAGLAGAQRAGYGPFETQAARMVDAQLPGVASRLRGLPAVVASGEGWPGRLLEEYALLHILCGADLSGGNSGADAGHGSSDDEVTATVRAQLGVPVPKEGVLNRPPVRDRWAVLAVREVEEERLRVRRTWLRGEQTGRLAMVLAFAPIGSAFDDSLRAGFAVEADVHFYPGAAPLRALIGARHGPFDVADKVPGSGLAGALAEWSGALAADPWTRSWPVVLRAVPLVDDDGWWLVDDDGSLPLLEPGEAGWSLLAASGGHPLTLLAEVVPGGVRGVAVL